MGQDEGDVNGDAPEKGFICSYDVIADDKHEALQLVKSLEPKDLRESLQIEKSEILIKKTRDPKGVYRMGVYNLYPRKTPKLSVSHAGSHPKS